MRFAPRLLLWLLEQMGGWHFAASTGAAMDDAGLNEKNWQRLDGESQNVISPSSMRATTADPYCVITKDGETRFLGHEMTPGIYAVYRPRREKEERWLRELERLQ